MTKNEFNELVWAFGEVGTCAEQIKNLSPEQVEVIAMAWNRSDMNDNEINSYYGDFIKCSN